MTISDLMALNATQTPAQLAFLDARRLLVLAAAEASGLPGLTPAERAQMQTIAGLAGLQLHVVGDHPNEGDARMVDEDLRRVMNSFQGLVGALIRAMDDRAFRRLMRSMGGEWGQ